MIKLICFCCKISYSKKTSVTCCCIGQVVFVLPAECVIGYVGDDVLLLSAGLYSATVSNIVTCDHWEKSLILLIRP